MVEKLRMWNVENANGDHYAILAKNKTEAILRLSSLELDGYSATEIKDDFVKIDADC
jgi:hypothetical protein